MDIAIMGKKELIELMNEVRELIIEVERTHKYSMSKIYGLTNKVFSQNETAQSCASCLIRKVDELRVWYRDAINKYAEMEAEIGHSNKYSSIGNYKEVVSKENTYLTEMKDSIVKSEKAAKTRRKKGE